MDESILDGRLACLLCPVFNRNTERSGQRADARHREYEHLQCPRETVPPAGSSRAWEG